MKRHLGIDFGSKRIGIAISDPLNIIARPIQYIYNSDKTVDEIKKLFVEYEIEAIVIGMPFNLKGEIGQKGQDVEQFINDVLGILGVKIIKWDERFSTKQAHQTLRDMNVKKKQRESKEIIDSMAAAIMLQSYLDSK